MRGWAAALAGGLLLAGCASTTSASPGAANNSLADNTASKTASFTTTMATSLTTARDAWAIVPMGANPAFWQVFARPATSADWKLVTPAGVADNGGLVAAGDGGSVTVAVRPSQDLTFSPLAVSADGGTRWTQGLLDAGIAAAPDALAASGSSAVALLADGTVMTSSDGGGTWRTLAKPRAITSSSAGARCGLADVTAVSFGKRGEVLAAGTCTGAGTGLLSYRDRRWQPVRLPVSGQVVRLAGDTALIQRGGRLRVVRETPAGWAASAPLAAGGLASSGLLGGDTVWVLLPDGGAAVTAGAAWHVLPRAPAGTSVLAAGPGDTVDALAVRSAGLDVWRLRGGTWSRVQAIDVPVQYGSSS